MFQQPIPSCTVPFNVSTPCTKLHGTILILQHPVASCRAPFQCFNALYQAAGHHFNVSTPCTKLHGTISYEPYSLLFPPLANIIPSQFCFVTRKIVHTDSWKPIWQQSAQHNWWWPSFDIF